MGQQCCSDDKLDNRVYNHSRLEVKESEKNGQSNLAVAYQVVEKEYQFVRNFSQVEQVPRTHHTVH